MISSPGCCASRTALRGHLDAVLDHLASRDAEIVLLEISARDAGACCTVLSWTTSVPRDMRAPSWTARSLMTAACACTREEPRAPPGAAVHQAGLPTTDRRAVPRTTSPSLSMRRAAADDGSPPLRLTAPCSRCRPQVVLAATLARPQRFPRSTSSSLRRSRLGQAGRPDPWLSAGFDEATTAPCSGHR